MTSHDEMLRVTRRSLIDFGSATGAFEASLCTCDNSDCMFRRPETYPMHVLLQDVARAAAVHVAPMEDEPPADAALRTQLVAFGNRFQLFRCPCAEPDCPATTASHSPLGDLAHATFLQWYGLSGCVGREGAEQTRRAAEIAIRNLHAVRVWTERLSQVPRVFLEEAIAASRTARESELLREAQSLAAACTDRWIPRFVALPEIEDAMDLVLVIAEAGEWTDEQAHDWLLLANDALLGLMTRDLLDPMPNGVLYAGIDPVIPLRLVRAAVVAGATGAPPGFFAFAT
jgi:hypothetical protein